MVNLSWSAVAVFLAATFQSTSNVDAFVRPSQNWNAASSTKLFEGKQAESFGPAQLLRDVKTKLPQIEWLAEGEGSPSNKVNMPGYVHEILSQPHAPKRQAENELNQQQPSCHVRSPSIAVDQLHDLGAR